MSFWMCVHHFLNCFHVSIISAFFSTLEPIPGVVEWELRYTWTGHTQTGTAGGGGRHQRLFLLRSNSANQCVTFYLPRNRPSLLGFSWTSHTVSVTNSTGPWFSKQQLSRRSSLSVHPGAVAHCPHHSCCGYDQLLCVSHYSWAPGWMWRVIDQKVWRCLNLKTIPEMHWQLVQRCLKRKIR